MMSPFDDFSLLSTLWQSLAGIALRWTPLALLALLAIGVLKGSPRDRRTLLFSTLLALPLLPLATELMPRWTFPDWRAAAGIEIEAPLTASAPAASLPVRTAPEPRPEPALGGHGMAPWLSVLWALGAAALLARDLFNRLGCWVLEHGSSKPPARLLEQALAAAQTLGIRPLEVRLARVSVPVLSGAFKPKVLLPPEAVAWPRERLEAALLHELSHARHGDPWIEATSSSVTALFWFHPVVWWLRRHLRHEMELLADASAARHGLGTKAYGLALVDIAAGARHPLPNLGLAMARQGGLESRLEALLAERRPASRALRAAVTGAGLAVALVAAGAAPPAVDAWLEATDGGWRLRCGEQALCQDVQKHAESLLEETGKSGVVVVLDTASGALMGYAAHGPSPTPVVPPASVAKLTLAALWWEAGLGTRSVPCVESWTGSGGVELQSVRAIADLEVPREMLSTSCTTAAGVMVEQLREVVPAATLAERLADFGFAADAESPLLPGWLPTPRHEAGEVWESRHPAMATMVGRVATTPLHVASFLQAIGADGLQREIARPDAHPGDQRRLFTAETAALMRSAMAGVMTDGTGRRAAKGLEGSAWQLLGKTGTRRRAEGGYDGWFGGLVTDDAGQARYAIVVFAENGGMGGGVAARTAARMTRFLGERL